MTHRGQSDDSEVKLCERWNQKRLEQLEEAWEITGVSRNVFLIVSISLNKNGEVGSEDQKSTYVFIIIMKTHGDDDGNDNDDDDNGNDNDDDDDNGKEKQQQQQRIGLIIRQRNKTIQL